MRALYSSFNRMPDGEEMMNMNFVPVLLGVLSSLLFIAFLIITVLLKALFRIIFSEK